MVGTYEPYVEVCRRLAELSPCGEGEQRSILVNSGAEAIENAVKIARAATGRPAVVVFDNGFHGRTLLTMTMTSKVVPYKKGFGPFAPEVYRAPAPYPYRGIDSDEAIHGARAPVQGGVDPASVACVVLEPVQGEGGFIPMPPDFPARLHELCREHGILYVDDEIQSGCARTGPVWAIEHYTGVEPDLLVSGKSLGGGLPLAAVTGRAEVMDAVDAGRARRHLRRQPGRLRRGASRCSTRSRRPSSGSARTRSASGCAPGSRRSRERSPHIGEVRGLGPMLGARARRRPRLEGACARAREGGHRRRVRARPAAALVRDLRQRAADARAARRHRRGARAGPWDPGGVACSRRRRRCLRPAPSSTSASSACARRTATSSPSTTSTSTSRRGEFFTMLGPSGSGKTTTLRLIAGFERPDAGRIELRGVDVAQKPPYERPVNTVFQDYALFPHMTVGENVEYGLRVRGVGRRDRRAQADRRARDGAAARVRAAQAGPALRRPAPARRARARDRQPAGGAAPRRAARRARPEAPPGDADRAEADPAGGRDHVHLRHARPGGGADDERPRRRLQRRPDRADRHARRDLRAPGDGVRGRLRRRLEPARAGRPTLHRAPREDPGHDRATKASRARSGTRSTWAR